MKAAWWTACATAVAALLLLTCGKSGSDGGSDKGATDGTTGGTVQPSVKAVTGQFFIGSAATPATGYELWLFDHTALTYARVDLDAAGQFSLPLDRFTKGDTYSFHLVRDFALVGDVDLAPATAGVQPAFVYEGGYGFDLGQVVVPLDKRGVPTAAGGIVGAVGGGFSLDTAASAGFGVFPLPPWLASLQFGSQLLATDPETILYSFNRRAVFPDLYARDLQRLSRVGLNAVSVTGTNIIRAFVLEGGAWLSGARLPAAADQEPEVAPLWRESGEELAKVEDGHFQVSAFAGGYPSAAMVLAVRVESDGDSSVAIPLALPRVVSLPPVVMAASGNGIAPATIDYASPTAVNGLTRPLCQSGDVILDVAPPLDGDGAAIPATTLNRVDVFVDFFGVTSQRTVPLTVTGDQLDAPYNAAVADTTLTDVKRDWDPATLRLRFTLGPAAAAGTTQRLTIWKGLLPSSPGGQTVTRIRLRIVYGSDGEATEGGTAIWLAKGC